MGAKEYINETKGELRHVKWPTQRQILQLTLIVVGLSVLTALFLFLFDLIFIRLLGYII